MVTGQTAGGKLQSENGTACKTPPQVVWVRHGHFSLNVRGMATSDVAAGNVPCAVSSDTAPLTAMN